MTEEKEVKKKKHGLISIIFKLITLGGLLTLIVKSLSKIQDKK